MTHLRDAAPADVSIVMGSDSDWPVMQAAAEALEEAFRAIVVVRGSAPMPVREALPLTLPAEAAARIAAQQEAAGRAAGTPPRTPPGGTTLGS